jgi:hypothetical protein
LIWKIRTLLLSPPIKTPRFPGIRGEENDEQQQERQSIQSRAKIAPQWRAVAWVPPSGKRQIEQKEYTDNASGTNPKSKQQANSNEDLDYTDPVPKKNGMGQDQPGQYWAIKTDCGAGNVALKISLESAMGKTRPG